MEEKCKNFDLFSTTIMSRLLYLHPVPFLHHQAKIEEIKKAGWNCLATENEAEVLQALKNESFDLFLTEFHSRFSFDLAEKINCKTALWYGDIRALGDIPEKLKNLLPVFDFFLVAHSDKRYFEQWKALGARKIIQWDNACREDFPFLFHLYQKAPYDFFFSGNFWKRFPGGEIRKRFLESLLRAGFSAYIIGSGWPSSFQAKPICPPIWNNEFAEHLKFVNSIILIENFPTVKGFKTRRFFCYLASGLPLFVFDAGAYEEEETGGIMFVKSENELIEKMKTSLQDEKLKHEIAIKNRKLVERCGHWRARFLELKRKIKEE